VGYALPGSKTVKPLCVCAIVLGACGGIVAPPPPIAVRPETPPAAPGLRLPAGVRPTRESLEIKLDPRGERFSGRAAIDLAVDREAAVIWLSAEGLDLASARIGATAARIFDTGQGMVGLSFTPPVAAGSALLVVEFAGQIDDRLARGLYRVKENDGSWYAYTFFRPMAARRAFPCFDEPGFRIPWKVTLIVPPGEQAFANAPVAARDRGADGNSIVSFAETRPLSPHLVGFVVGPFESIPAGLAGGGRTPLRFIVPRGRAPFARYAAVATPRIAELLEALTSRPYPFEKLDVVFVPRRTGAVGQPGLVLVDQAAGLIDPDVELAARRRAFVEHAAPELARVWFGDLATPAWWDDLWLDGSLARWAALTTLVAFEPSWQGGDEAVLARDAAMTRDALPGARPVHASAATADDLVGPAEFVKGAAILAMFDRWVGHETFRRLIARYLDERSLATATTDDLLAALDSSADHRMAGALRTFLDQPGVPLVSARAVCPPGDPPGIELHQRRFFAAGAHAAEGRWRIPVCVAWGDGDERNRACQLLVDETATLLLDRCPRWILPNDGATGYYRSELTVKAAAALLQSGKLSVAERVSLAGDVAALVGTTVPLGEALALVPILAADPDAHVVAASLGLLGKIRRADLIPELSARYARFVRKSYGPRARSLGWRRRSAEPEVQAALRQLLLPLLIRSGDDAELAEEARAQASRWTSDSHEIEAVMVATTLEASGASGSHPLWLKLHDAAVATRDRTERALLLSALGGFDDAELARASLVLLLAPEVDPHDAFPIVARELDGQRTREVAYGFIKESWNALAARLDAAELRELLGSPAAFCDPGHRADAEGFFAPRTAGIEGGARALTAALETVDACIARTQADAKGLEAFLLRQ